MIQSENTLKAVAFDLDDTVLHDDLTISGRTLKTLRRLHEAGIVLVAASGRTLMSMKPFTDQISCISLCIACNGALIWNPSDRSILHRETFSMELCHEIVKFGNEFHCYEQTYSDDRFYFNEVSEYSRRYAAVSMLPGECVGDLSVFIREPRSKILMMADEKLVSQMLVLARERFEGRASVTCSKPYFLEFNPPSATKGVALGKAAGMLGLSPENFVAFGDSLNDLPMLRAAGRSVAVANGRPDILAVCDDICPSNQEDGVARYLAEHFLGEEAQA